MYYTVIITIMRNFIHFFLIIIYLILLPISSKAQFKTIGEYSFISQGYFIGQPSDLKESSIIKTLTIINIIGTETYKSIQKVNDFNSYSYGFYNAYTNENKDGVWVMTEKDYNRGLIEVIYDPSSLIMEFKFKDGTSEIHFNTKRTK